MKYPKIRTVFRRDRNGIIIPWDFYEPTFEYLRNNLWICREKIDGMNIRIEASLQKDGSGWESSISGRSEDSVLSERQKTFLTNLVAKFDFDTAFGPITTDDDTITIFGELYGGDIRNGERYSKDYKFAIFDIALNGNFYYAETTMAECRRLLAPMVPIIGIMKLSSALELVKTGFDSLVTDEGLTTMAEGLVLEPKVPMYDHMNNRVITKIKHRDFVKYELSKFINNPDEHLNEKMMPKKL